MSRIPSQWRTISLYKEQLCKLSFAKGMSSSMPFSKTLFRQKSTTRRFFSSFHNILSFDETRLRKHDRCYSRRFSLLASIQASMASRTEKKQLEQFKEQIKSMSEVEHFSLKTFKDTFDKQAKDSWFNWINKVPGVNQTAEIQEADKAIKILSAFKDEELLNTNLIKGQEKLRISTKTGQSVQEINQLLFQFEQAAALHKWIRKRIANKKDLPSSPEELQYMIQLDPSGLTLPQSAKNWQKKQGRRR